MPGPTILLLPGAWQTPEINEPLVSLLRGRGMEPLNLPASFPSVEPKAPQTTNIMTDATFIRKILVQLIGAGKSVVVFAHSYGPIPASFAIRGLEKRRREQQGLKGGVVGLINLAAFLTRQGQSLLEAAGGAVPPWYVDNPATGLAPVPPFSAFSAEIPPELHAWAKTTFRPVARKIFYCRASKPCWMEEEWKGRIAYITCGPNFVCPQVAQEGMIEMSGVDWLVRDIQGGRHYPFLWEETKMDFVRILEEIVALWTTKGAGGEEEQEQG